MMTANEKMLKALKTAKSHLEDSMMALNKKDEDSFDKSLWDTAAELEYALFLFSITFQNESDKSNWKPNPDLKKIETGSVLVEAENLLKEAEKSIANKNLQNAYRNAYIARHYLLKVQEDLAKKKREVLKNK